MGTKEDDAIPPIHFAPARGARLAYQLFGEGPTTIVSIPPMAQNIEAAWERSEIRGMFDRFASFTRFLQFDKRGTGASDRRSQVGGIDERVEDLRAVMDHAGIDRAHFFANSEGGPMAILFAATYPDRAESLTLWGTGASMMPADMTEQQRAERELGHEWFQSVWGTPDSLVVDRFAPSLAGDQEFRSWHQRYERGAASMDSLHDLLELTFEMDVREILPELRLPTLVLHRTGDLVVPIEFGRELADGIEGAKFVEYEGFDHFSYAGDMAWMEEVERFVTGELKPHPAAPTSAPTVRIVTLGRFSVERDGREVPNSEWGSRRARQLCKRLVAARGWPVTRDELFDLLWPDEFDRRRLGARLSVQLSAVRRVLSGGVVADRQTVSLDIGEVTTDLEAFYAAADDGEIVTAYAGEFLPDDLYEDWTSGIRDEARSRYVAAVRRLALASAQAGDDHDAGQWARRLIDVETYDEMAHQLLVRSLHSAGELGEARHAHARWVSAMAELDVSVSPLEEITNS